MSIYFTRKDLPMWAGKKVFEDGRILYEAGRVQNVACQGEIIEGVIGYGNRVFSTRFGVNPDGTVDNQCPCRDSRERGIVCMHVVAVALAWAARVADPSHDRAERMAARRELFRRKGTPAGFLRRAPGGSAGAVPAAVQVRLEEQWLEHFAQGQVKTDLFLSVRDNRQRLDKVDMSRMYGLSAEDELLLYAIEDLNGERPLPGEVRWTSEQFVELLYELRGREVQVFGESGPRTVEREALQPHLEIRFVPGSGTLRIRHHVVLPDGTEACDYLAGSHQGWAYARGHLYPLEAVLPEAVRPAYRGTFELPREAVPPFLFEGLPAIEERLLVDTDIRREDLRLEPGKPVFELELSGTLERLQPRLLARYGEGRPLPAGLWGHQGIEAYPVAGEPKRYAVRDPEEEDSGLKMMAARGVKGMNGDNLEPILGVAASLNFIASQSPGLRSAGWSVSFAGELAGSMKNIEWVQPELSISKTRKAGWFEVAFRFETQDGQALDAGQIEDAMLAGESFIEQEGRYFLLDDGALKKLNAVFDDCSVKDEIPYSRLTVADIHAGYIHSSLQGMPDVQVAMDDAWERQVEKQNRKANLAEEPLPGELSAILRSYQREGVNWLRYMEISGFSGILADEMGLGKTVQTLAWLSMPRAAETARGKPALIVCPTSLVENWASEAARFTPQLKVCVISGAKRHKQWSLMDEADLVITSYALLRRDIDVYKRRRFSVAVLDEAQHIKNHSTQNAQSTKQIRADYRAVLTGTPIENSVTDLWSIMDFLMPGYLGAHNQFKYVYEMPIANQTPEASLAHNRLRRKVHPFLLRRLKKDVAKELPPKIERIALCTMTDDQQRVYQRLLALYRDQISSMVQENGFDKARFEIFKTLLRLRQVCCHLALLKDPAIKFTEPSGKMDLFLELMDEIMDSGNRVLVFSQFVSMLKILREELDRRSIAYCYLDGATKDRLELVNKFNGQANIPAFLISLKAGGTGLNLTGADTVIHYDPWWNPAVEDQATDRAHRIGQLRTVYSVKLITKNSIEEKVLAMQQRKKTIIDATLMREDQFMKRLSWDDVQELLREEQP